MVAKKASSKPAAAPKQEAAPVASSIGNHVAVQTSGPDGDVYYLDEAAKARIEAKRTI